MKKNKVVQLVILASFLTTIILLMIACQRKMVAVTPEPEPVMEEVVVAEVAETYPTKYYSVRAFLLPDTDIIYDFGAYGYLILTERSKERNKEACEAFMTRIVSIKSKVYSDKSQKSLMPTYWLLRREAKVSGVKLNCISRCDNHCDFYLDYYHYDRADEIAQSLGIYADGPILVAFKDPYEYYQYHGKMPKEYLKFDLSKFSDEDIEDAILKWKEQIAKNPEMWDGGFQIEMIREVCQNFLNKYGGMILAVIK